MPRKVIHQQSTEFLISVIDQKDSPNKIVWGGLFQIKQLLFIAILFVALAFIGYLSTISVLKIELSSTIASDIEVFWTDEKKPFSPAISEMLPTEEGQHTYWFFLKDFTKSSYLRVDPARLKTDIKIDSIKLYSLQHFPVEINLFNHSTKLYQVKEINPLTPLYSHAEYRIEGDDPQIEIKPIQTKSPIVFIGLLILIIAVVFPKKHYKHAFFLFFGLVFLYYLLSFNDTTVSFRVNAEKAGEIKIFWRDKNEAYSKNRVNAVTILPGANNYQLKTGNLSNIEFLYLDAGKNQAAFKIDGVKIKELGFKEFSFSGNESVIDKQGDSTQLLFSVILFFACCILVLWVIFYYPKNKRFFYYKLFPNLIYVVFFYVLILVLNLAWQSDYNIHPDESAHIASIEYFGQFWDPPAIGDSRALNAYQAPWAISRLDDIGIGYFFAGKFSNVMQTFFSDKTFLARAFNIFLFMIFFISNKNKRLLLFLTPLLCTPQIWYLYSYANRGGFVLFISVLLAWQLVNKKSYLNQFLQGKKTLTHWRCILFPSLLLGILAIEQTNYILFILFVFSVLLWELLFFVKNKKIFIYKCLIFMVLGVTIFLIRYGIDVSINGFNKSEQRIAYAEQYAAPDFKPSKAITKDSYPGLRLRSKGIGFTEIFEPQWDWHKMSFKSFTGFYGYYAEYSPKWYYSYVLLIYLIILVVVLRHAIFQASWRYKLYTALTVTAILGGLLMSMIFSWLYDFQPQGRYVFPIIPIMLVYFYRMYPQWSRQEKATLLTSVIVLMILSFYSFNEVALNYLVS